MASTTVRTVENLQHEVTLKKLKSRWNLVPGATLLVQTVGWRGKHLPFAFVQT